MIPTQQNTENSPRDTILAAASELFRRQGYNATSMRQIAKAAGYGTVAGLYNHFENKEAIFAALLEYNAPYDKLFPALEAIQADTAEAFLRQFYREIVPIMRNHLNYLQLLLIDLQEFDGRLFSGFAQRVFPRFAALLPQVMSFPGMRTDLLPATVLRTIASVTIGHLLTEIVAVSGALNHLPVDPVLGDEWVEELISILLHGLTEDVPVKSDDKEKE
jgi:AcrR family transcriptional regulator